MLIKKFILSLRKYGLLPTLKRIVNYLTYKETIDEVNVVFNILKKEKGTMIDVGAHYGSALGKFADNGWKVFAFEPDKNNRKILTDNYATYPNVTIDPRGCSDKEEENVPFFTSDESTGISGLSSFVDSHLETDKVDIITLSKYIEENKIQNVDFLKIDTEGFDYFVLKGFPFEKIKPKMIVCEFEDKKTIPLGYTYQDLGKFLKKLGYEVVISEWYPIQRYGISHNWNCFKVFPESLDDKNAWGNFVACEQSLFKELNKEFKKL